jgi:hypothetical protein
MARNSGFLREQAARCLRLADKVREPDIAAELMAIAQAFLERAEREEQNGN